MKRQLLSIWPNLAGLSSSVANKNIETLSDRNQNLEFDKKELRSLAWAKFRQMAFSYKKTDKK